MLIDNVHTLGSTLGTSLRLFLLESRSTVLDQVRSLSNDPLNQYRAWWINLLKEDPTHVAIETFLLLFLAYLLIFQRAENWKKESRENLTEREKDQLVEDWQPAKLKYDGKLEDYNPPIVTNTNGVYMDVQLGNNFSAKKQKKQVIKALNMCSFDFLGLGGTFNKSMKNSSRDTLEKYGCGSCGPRGFYGTIDVHLSLEKTIANFCKTDDAIMYSDGASAVSSAVAAFAKRGDLLIVDEGVYEALQTGVTLSRSKVKYFRHNDMDDLRRVLIQVDAMDKKLGRKSNDQRRFIVVEGLYRNYGHVAPIDQLVMLKREFGYRLIVDESFSFGTLGTKGLGAIESHGMEITKDVEIVTISLEYTLGSIGGVCVGDEEVIDHQRLSGAGYCFSASAPPFTASAARESLYQMESNKSLLSKLKSNRTLLCNELKKISELKITSDPSSSLVYLQLSTCSTENENEVILKKIVYKCLLEGVAFIYTGGFESELLQRQPPPSIRITVTAAHSREDILKSVQVLKTVTRKILKKS